MPMNPGMDASTHDRPTSLTQGPGANADHPHLVELDQDHPGFRDHAYRGRRNHIARLALNYRRGPVPRVQYADEEHEVWRYVFEELRVLHRQYALDEVCVLGDNLDLDASAIPQFAKLNPRLEDATGFRMHPVAGLVNARAFLEALADRVFLATQYVRHPSAPKYTPEPDVIHELVGHAATLTHPGVASLNRRIGLAAKSADDGVCSRLERVYWHALEFGAAYQDGNPRAFGAGLLSSFGEIQAFGSKAQLREFDVERMAQTDYDPTAMQPVIFVAESFDVLLQSVNEWLDSAGL